MTRPAKTDAPVSRAEIARDRRAAILHMTRAGLPALKIALTLGVSPQAVYWHINKLRAEGELPSDAA